MRSLLGARRPSETGRAQRGLVAGRSLGLGILYWTPVWAALVCFAQVSLLGLRPVLEERHAIEGKATALEQRIAGERQKLASIDAWLGAQDDPIYRERMRRILRDPGRNP